MPTLRHLHRALISKPRILTHIETGLRYRHLAQVRWAGADSPGETLELYSSVEGAFTYDTDEWRPPGTLYVRQTRSFAKRFADEEPAQATPGGV